MCILWSRENQLMEITQILKALLSEMRSISSSKTVIGDPIVVGDATIVPVNRLGLGFGIAQVLAREGVRVALSSRSQERLEEASAQVEGETDETGTTVTFHPDGEIFPQLEYSFDVLSKRLRELS